MMTILRSLFSYNRVMESYTCDKGFIEQIANGVKKYEMRLWLGNKAKLQQGDILELVDKDDFDFRMEFVVKRVAYYPDFMSALQELGWQNFIPEADSIYKAKRIYEQLYQRRNLNKYLVVVYEL